MAYAGGALTQARRKQNRSIQRLHEKTFRAWINNVLKDESVCVDNLFVDLGDGIVLIRLLEVLASSKCREKWHATPRLEIHKMENVAIAIRFLRTFVVVDVLGKDIVDGNAKVILGLVWRLIVRFRLVTDSSRERVVEEDHHHHPAQEGASGPIPRSSPAGPARSTPPTSTEKACRVNAAEVRSARARLLGWIQQQMEGYDGEGCVSNFSIEEWRDGKAFAMLIHSIMPDAIDMDAFGVDSYEENLTLAFAIAEDELGIPPLLEPEDMCAPDKSSQPDEQCLMTYLSEFPAAARRRATLLAAEKKAREKRQSAITEQRAKQMEASRMREAQMRADREAALRADELLREKLDAEKKKLEELREKEAEVRTSHEHVQTLLHSATEERIRTTAVAAAATSDVVATSSSAMAIDEHDKGNVATHHAVVVCKAKHTFKGVKETDLPFRKGDTIKLLSFSQDKKWWTGECNGRTGQFPFNYVRLPDGVEVPATMTDPSKKIIEGEKPAPMKAHVTQVKSAEEVMVGPIKGVELGEPRQPTMTATDEVAGKPKSTALRGRVSLKGSTTTVLGILSIVLREARGVPNTPLGLEPDIYCEISMEGRKEKTAALRRSAEGWNAAFEFNVTDPDALLRVDLFSVRTLVSDDFLGRVTIEVEELENGKETEKWYKMHHRKAKLDGKVKAEVLMSVKIER